MPAQPKNPPLRFSRPDCAPWQGRDGSAILIVLVTIMFATVAMYAFIERASNDLLVEKRSADASRLRLEGYSALETTLAVLNEFNQANGALRSPAEGWDDPLAFAGYEPTEGRTVEITFSDESGKFSLPKVTQATLVNLFKAWQIPTSDEERLADAILGWMQKDYVASSAGAPDKADYEREEIPYHPASRPLRSFNELATIAVARDIFYDENGQPNEFWHRFVSAFSLYSYQTPSINGASPELLAGLGVPDTAQQKRLTEYLSGGGSFQNQGPRYFKSSADVSTMLGEQSPASQLDTQIRALRIIVTVREGRSSFRINALIAPPGGATIPEPAPSEGDPSQKDNAATPEPTKDTSGQNAKKLNYPFTILEFRENDEMTSSPTPPTP